MDNHQVCILQFFANCNSVTKDESMILNAMIGFFAKV